MDSNNKRLRQDQQQHSQESLHQSSSTSVQSYHSVEDMLRKDAEQNPPPDSLSHRVATSATAEVPQSKPWWRKLMGD